MVRSIRQNRTQSASRENIALRASIWRCAADWILERDGDLVVRCRPEVSEELAVRKIDIIALRASICACGADWIVVCCDLPPPLAVRCELWDSELAVHKNIPWLSMTCWTPG